MAGPVLAKCTTERGATFTVHGGLHFIRSNGAPHFSLTYNESGPDGGSGGAGHDEILKRFPQFADLAALHLSYIDGVPLHAVGNGFYHLGGCTEFRPGQLYERRDDPYGAKYDVAARALRITEDEARALVRDLFGDSFSETGGFLSKSAQKAAEARLAAWCETQKPRWKAEADACIARHGLVVYGDPWPVSGS